MSNMSEGLSLSVSEDGFAKITMNNGENRFRTPTITMWNQLLDQVLSNPKTKALLIVGTGKFFSNGIDLDWLSQQKGDVANNYYNYLKLLIERVLVFPIPTVALINGLRFGDPLLKVARTKIPPGVVQRDALVFAKRLTGDQAFKLQVVDAVVEEPKMEEVGKNLALIALGKRGLERGILHAMKKDVYGLEIKFVGEAKL